MDPLLVWGLGLLALAVIIGAIDFFLASGAMAVIAVVSAAAGVVCLFQYDAKWGVSGLLALLVLIPLSIWGFVKVWPHTAVGKRILNEPSEEEVSKTQQAEEAANRERAGLIGKVGTVVTELRPVGLAEFDGKRLEVMAETTLLGPGTKIRIVSADGMMIKVRAM
jgi:membrane-bound serine protease (ClpP class)